MKSWSCCDDVNKPVLDFDEFMQIPGCTVGPHTTEVVKQDAPKASPDVNLKMTSAESGKETYSSNPRATQTLAKAAPPEPVAPPEEEEDDASVPVEPGTKCRRNGCKHTFVSDAVSRVEGGDESECRYHPLPRRKQGSSTLVPSIIYDITLSPSPCLRVTYAASVAFWNLKNSSKYKAAKQAVISSYPRTKNQFLQRN